ncbi:MAG: SDR family oxidoreductase [Spirochaetota bacterium]|nr:MAG: SDR family oxidoreductase [Spirochaetota bacterium]
MQIPEITLKEKVVLITGGSRGAGAAYALACAKAGAEVAVFARGSLNNTGKNVKKETGKDVLPINGDMRNLADVERMVEETVKHFGKLDVLVNNAGICESRSLLEATEEDWDSTLDVNLKGVFFACKYAARHMIPKRSGVIINIGSEVSHVGAAEEAIYCASKGGLFIMSQALALELAPHNIRVVTLCPGPINTDMTAEWLKDPANREKLSKISILGRINEPEDLAPTLVLLASDAARNVTGCSWSVDCGALAK